jgi:hypothetical protein
MEKIQIDKPPSWLPKNSSPAIDAKNRTTVEVAFTHQRCPTTTVRSGFAPICPFRAFATHSREVVSACASDGSATSSWGCLDIQEAPRLISLISLLAHFVFRQP